MGNGICGTIVEKIMQVYTTVFLAETLRSETSDAEKSIGDHEMKRGLPEIKRARLEYITMLEARNWFLDDFPSED